MAAVQQGEVGALSELVERHHSLLLGYLYRMVGSDRMLAEDLVQETFVRLLGQPHYQPTRPFKPWLYAIATNLVRDHFKSAVVRHAAPAVAVETLLDSTINPEALALAAAASSEVSAAIANLPEEYRTTLLMRFYADMSLQEIANALDVPLGTVKSRLSVSCRRLRQMLSEKE